SGAPTPAVLAPATSGAALLPAAPPTSSDASSSADAARVKRFLGALLGGAVGVALPLALAPAFSCASGFIGVTASCFAPAHYALAIASPLLGLTGSLAGYVLAGGQPSAAGFGAIVPAALVTLGVMAFTSQMETSPLALWVPGVIAGASVLALTSALLLTWREDHVVSATEAAGVRAGADRVRVAMSLVASTALGLAGTFVSLLALSGCYSCSVAVPMTLVGGLLAAQAFAVWGIHRALGGRAPPWAPLVALAIDLAAAGVVMLAAWLPSSTPMGFSEGARNALAATVAGVSTSIALTVVPTLLFEALHTRAVDNDGLAVRLGGGPVQGGGMITAGVEF
ncbi:MAG: hypothetical protein AB1938_24435, partial [Myxococcota bacterium]